MSFKSGFVAVVGRPNVGKSTLINALTGEKILITSSKPQTTRNSIKAIITDQDSQIIFMDTPGIHDPRTKLGKYMVGEAFETMKDVDAVLLLIEASDKIGPNEEDIINSLSNLKLPVILIINKIDTVNKDILLPLIAKVQPKMKFEAIIPISALKNESIETVRNEIKKLLPEGPEYFPGDILTDESERFVASEFIREKILELTHDEVPHGTAVEIMSFKEREGKNMLDISATIYCEKETHKAILIGKKGEMLKRIGTRSRSEMEKFFGVKVFLELWVKVKDDWRNSDFILKTLGYKRKK